MNCVMVVINPLSALIRLVLSSAYIQTSCENCLREPQQEQVARRVTLIKAVCMQYGLST